VNRGTLGVAAAAAVGVLLAGVAFWASAPEDTAPGAAPIPRAAGEVHEPTAGGSEVKKVRPASSPAPRASASSPVRPEADLYGDPEDDGSIVGTPEGREEAEHFLDQLAERKELLDQRYEATVKMLEAAGVPEGRIDAVEAVAAEMNRELVDVQRAFLTELFAYPGLPDGLVARYRQDQALLEAEYSPRIVEALGEYATEVPSATLDAGRYLDVDVPALREIPGWE
jgi:hypothetical protein